MRSALTILLSVLVYGSATSASEQPAPTSTVSQGDVQIEIQSPTANFSAVEGETTIAWATGGSFVQVSDPTMLPEAFLNLHTTVVDSVTLSVNGSNSVPARLAGGTFSGSVPLAVGENRIVGLATSRDGQIQESATMVNVRDASCVAVEVKAVNEGRPVPHTSCEDAIASMERLKKQENMA